MPKEIDRSKLPRAVAEGVMMFGDISVRVAVLTTGQHVLMDIDMAAGLGVGRGGGSSNCAEMPSFARAANVKACLEGALLTAPNWRVYFIRKDGRGLPQRGIDARAVPVFLMAIVDADRSGALHKSQEALANGSARMVAWCAGDGLVARIEENTGWWLVRAQAQLDHGLRLVQPEADGWSKVFPDSFKTEVNRLKGWRQNPRIHLCSPEIGNITRRIVWARLAPGVQEAVEERNPSVRSKKTGRSYRRNRHHQHLTREEGMAALTGHLHGVGALMRARGDGDWAGFAADLDRAYPVVNRAALLTPPTQRSSIGEPLHLQLSLPLVA